MEETELPDHVPPLKEDTPWMLTLAGWAKLIPMLKINNSWTKTNVSTAKTKDIKLASVARK